ncbi:MAG: FkbM family methyltransferase [Reyranella sp.]|nr:FkbM family methyltransferase [Reyranella sp.]
MGSLSNLRQLIASHPLMHDAQVAAWARFALYQARICLQTEVVTPWVGGQRLALRRGMTGATGNHYVGLHEFTGMMLLLHFLRAGDLFLDIGANVGSYSVLASGVCRATTWAFEPDPDTVGQLRRQIEINGLEHLVEVHSVALGPADGEVPLTIDDGSANRVDTSVGAKVRLVPQRSLDDVIGGRRPAMIKIDVEGYEEEVLRGAGKVLAAPSLKVIAQEMTTPWMLEQLSGHGFTRAFYDPFTRRLARSPGKLDYSNGQWTASNEFFVRDWAFVEQRLATARPVTILGRTL